MSRWPGRTFQEFRRRKVFRVAVAYGVAGWIAVQIAATSFPYLGIPAWAITLVIVLVILGFPVALILAWAYDLTPGGVQRTATEGQPGKIDWREAQRVLNAALELPAADRPAFLDRACSGEPDLRREVETLLDAHDRESILDRPPATELATPRHPSALEHGFVIPAARGRTVSTYQILEKLGGGGMGVVYKARDPRLERSVALKFLPPHLSADIRSKDRFLVEAQAAAALDHPNICTVHEIGETEDGHLFIAMPFYEGETLKRRIARGAIPLDRVLDYGAQISRGLAKAHEQGIVHRDIKPANLVLTSDEVVKIVDFGVAKLVDVSVTKPGGLPGTVAYMSPEQAQGEEVDGRTDIWSLGVVLYEMLTGERPFRGTHDGLLLRAIVENEPTPVAALCPGLPINVERIVARALAKRPEDRFRTAREMAEALEAVGSEPGPSSLGRAPKVFASAAAGANPAGVLPEGERRQATVLFAAVSGYDAMLESLTAAEVEAVLERLRHEVGSVGGTVNQFTGEDLMLLFGIPAADEEDPVRAARAAIELGGRVAALSREVQSRGGPAIELRVGIDTGSIVARDGGSEEQPYLIAGAPAKIARQLAAHAAAGEIWVSAECHGRIAPFFHTREEPPIVVRDRSESLIPHRVLQGSGLRTRLEAAEKAGLTAYTGREAELGTLQRSLRAALAGEGQLVAVVGEAGLGKSRLLHEFRQGAEERGIDSVQGRCQSYGSAVAYLPFIDILRTGFELGDGGVTPERTVEKIRAIASELEEFIPLYLHLLNLPSARHPLPRHLQGDPFRLAMQEALTELLTRCSRNTPVAVLLEDWHWADEASQAVLKGLAEIVASYSMLVVVTTRPGYGVDLGDPVQRLTIPLRPLEVASSHEIVRSYLQVHSYPEELGELLHERTGGNPFFLEETCQALLEDRSIRVVDGEAQLLGPLQMLELPDSVQGVIRARLDRLDHHSKDVLRLASVVGREFTREILDLTAAEPEPLSGALQSLKAAGLIQQTRVGREPIYRFKHILTQEVAYGSLLDHQRRDLHGRVGTAIERLRSDQLDDEVDRLAHHFSRAEQWERAVGYGLQSAERASRLAQFAEALQILERTQRWLARIPAGEKRRDAHLEILLRQERLCETLGQRNRQQQIIDELISLLDDPRDQDKLAEAYLRQGDLFTLLRRFEEAQRALDRSLEIRRELGDSIGERNTLRSLGLLRWHEGRNDEALEIARLTLRIDRQRQDRVGIVGDLTNLGAILRAVGDLEQAQSVLEEALAEINDAEETSLEDELSTKLVYVLHHLANIHRARGNREEALQFLHRAGEVAKEKRMPIQLSYHRTSLAHVHFQDGQVEESLRYYEEAIDITRKAKYAPGLAYALLIRGEVLAGLARYADALVDLEEAAGIFTQLKDADNEARVWTQIATALEQTGEPGAAMAAWSRAATRHQQAGRQPDTMLALEGLGRATRHQMTEPSLALGHYRSALALALELRDREAEGRIRNTIGILEWERGDYAAALYEYEQALDVYHDLEDRVHQGLMLNSIGVTLQAMRRWEDARETLEEAADLNARSGQRRLQGHALAALGDVLNELGQPARAEEHYRSSLAIRRDIGDQLGEGWMLNRLARAASAAGRPDDASALLDSALLAAEECGDAELTADCERLRRIPAY